MGVDVRVPATVANLGPGFDCLGVAVSLLNRWVVRRTTPTTRDIIVWDTRILPISRQLDPLLGHRVGKSFVAIACL